MNHSITGKKHLLMVFLFAYLSTAAHARIWRVNNNTGVVADFTNLTAAVAAAANDDIIYVEPSATQYDNNTVTINKKLKIIGNGSFLSDHPGLQINSNDSYVSYITFARGSAGSSAAGIKAVNFAINDSVNDITIQRCRMNTIQLIGSGSNIFILENWLSHLYRQQGGIRTNLLIRNNIFSIYINLLVNDSSIIENNTIVTYSYIPLDLNNATRVTVINNIFLRTSGSTAQTISGGSFASFSNNICSDNSLPAGSGNQNNVVPANVIVNVNLTTDGHAELKAGSPAIDMGLYGNGDDIGAFNNGTGRTSFKLGLIPPVPTIYSLSGVGVVNTPTMNVTISTRSNN